MKQLSNKSRREFIAKMATGAAAGVGMLNFPFDVSAETPAAIGDPDAWFKNAKGKHRIVYDATEPNDGFAFIWSWVFYKTNNATGTPDNDMTAMVVLRHNAMPFALNDAVWSKYKFGEAFNVTDNNTKAPATRNPYYEPKGKDFPLEVIDGIKKLQERGVMFCVCDMALTVFSMEFAAKVNRTPEEVKKEWVDGLLKDVQIVPSGVWAVGRAQENGFQYCYAGG